LSGCVTRGPFRALLEETFVKAAADLRLQDPLVTDESIVVWSALRGSLPVPSMQQGKANVVKDYLGNTLRR
jgi:hypothetical protein